MIDQFFIMRDLVLCLLVTANLLVYGFIGLNYGAFQQVLSYKSQPQAPDIVSEASNLPPQTSAFKPQASSSSSKSLSLKDTKKSLQYWQGTLHIPRLNISAPISYHPETSIADIQNVLSEGTMSLSPFIPPSVDKQMVIFGHSSDYSWRDNPYHDIFALLPQLVAGDTIKLTHKKRDFWYQITNTQVTDPELTGVVQENPDHNQLILSTCYPIGFFGQRFNVIAEPTFISPDPQISPAL